jgi:hypothetical protein
MNANINACPENRSANIGKRGDRGIRGITGIPGTYSTTPGLPGELGSPGSNRIDVQFREGTTPFYKILAKTGDIANDVNLGYIIFPGKFAWGGDLQKIKIALSLDFEEAALGEIIAVELIIKDVTNPLDKKTVLTLDHFEKLEDVSRKERKKVVIVQNGSGQNNYATIGNLTDTEALFLVTARVVRILPSNITRRSNTYASFYSLEMY